MCFKSLAGGEMWKRVERYFLFGALLILFQSYWFCFLCFILNDPTEGKYYIMNKKCAKYHCQLNRSLNMKERTVDYILSVLDSMSCQSSLYNRQKILTSFFLCGLFLLGFILYQIAPQEMSVLSDLQFLQSTSDSF